MIEIIIGEAIAGLSATIIGCLYFADKIHKREVDKDTIKPRHVVLKVPAKPEPELPIEKDPRIAALENEMSFCRSRLSGGSLKANAGIHYRSRIKEITNEIVKIFSEKK